MIVVLPVGPTGVYSNTSGRILDSIVVSIPACHAGDPGSIPGRGEETFSCVVKKKILLDLLNVPANTLIFFIRDAFIRDELMSTQNFGKIRDGEYSKFLRYKG